MSRRRATLGNPEESSGDAIDEAATDQGTATDEGTEPQPESTGESTEPQPESTGESTATDGADPTGDPAPRPRPRPGPAVEETRRVRQRGPVLLAAGVLLTIAAIVAAVVAIRREDPPAAARTSAPTSNGAGLTSPVAAQAFVAGATADVTAVTAYDYRSLDIALTSGLAVTTGTYRQAYRAAITGDLGRMARAERIVQTFQQTAAGIGTVTADGNSAKVLIFGVESVARSNGAPVATPVTLTATVVRQGDRYLIAELEAGTNAGLPPGTPQLAEAAETARSHTLASLTLRRSTLTADFDAALADTVEPRRSALSATLGPLRRAVERGDYQLTGRVTAIAVERVVGNAVAVLVAATGLRISGRGPAVVTNARLRVTAIRVGSGWEVADSQAVSS